MFDHSMHAASSGDARSTASRRARPGLLAVLVTIAAGAFAAPPAVAVNQTVRVADYNFTSPAVAVRPGETVKWEFPTGVDHHNVVFENTSGVSVPEYPVEPEFAPWFSPAVTFSTPGEYRYFCEHHGSFGRVGMSGVVYVNATDTIPGQTPTASFSATPGNTVVGQDVAVSAASSTDPENDIVRYEWDFEDDKVYEINNEGVSTTYAYPAAGSYTVRLRVTDRWGRHSETTRTVTVAEPSTPPPAVVTPPPAAVTPPVVTPPPAALPAPPVLAPTAPAATPKLGSTVSYTARRRGSRTVLSALSVRRVVAGSTVRLSCSGRGCPFRVKTRQVTKDAAKFDLTPLVRGKQLRSGTKLEVRVTKPGSTGIVRRLTIRSNRSPKSENLCLAPGATRPAACA